MAVDDDDMDEAPSLGRRIGNYWWAFEDKLWR